MPPYNPQTDTPKKAARRRWYHNNRQHSLDDMKQRRQQLKDQCFAAYGGYKCACCGETEKSFLCLDHVYNDGYAHRKEINSRGGIGIYYWIRKNNFPAGIFQVLCYNCNQSKRLNGGLCAHRKETMGHSFEQSGPGDSIIDLRRPDGHAHLDQKYDKGMRSPWLGQIGHQDAGLQSPEVSGQGGSGHMDSGYSGQGGTGV